MDWKGLIKKTKNLTEKSKPLIQKAKTYGSGAIAFVGKQVEQTPIFLKTEEEYNIEVSKKRSIIVAYDSTTQNSEFIQIMIPVWSTLAWTDTASIRYIELSGNMNLGNNLNIKGPLEMRISFIGEESFRFNTEEDIRKWWKNRQYVIDSETTESQNTDKEENNTIVDPITEATKQPLSKKRK